MGHPEAAIDVPVAPDSVWAVLEDGWLYPLWVVGASHMRDVDDAWPAVGSRLHHSVGPWPLQVSDSTEVLDVEPGRMLTLRARAWPFGTAKVVITLETTPSGCRVRLAEEVEHGLGWFVPELVQAPFVEARNSEALSRLADIATERG
ncbi:SRPBCC family protein [Actinomycetospora straminea]|uniref:SRPBCC family protein n=1 Tax=Actinomycetospora straminea TaxID=663607 RepID=A0ABP9EEP0_9PSEU|nr:SRPBCC family protein [Actinomycetospora straminea]MDD7935615.1 SRPBCC family protein [Actinomycetospora straminea]